VSPWVVDGEDLTRKSTRLSSGSSGAPSSDSYSGGGPSGLNAPDRFSKKGDRTELRAPTAIAAVSSTDESAASNVLEAEESSKAKQSRRSTRKSREKAREEEEYQEFLASVANQPRLLTDLDREDWIGTVVTYLPTQQRGRVTEYRSGWAVVRTVHGVVNSRPYQLEVVEAGSAELAQYEDEEMWALCGEHDKSSSNAEAVRAEETVTSALAPSALSDYLFDPAISDALMEGLDPMYGAFTNDTEYEDFLLSHFGGEDAPIVDAQAALVMFAGQLQQDPAVAVPLGGGRVAPKGLQAVRDQQLKPARTKLIDAVPLSAEEQKRRMIALAKSRAQVQKMLQAAGVAGGQPPTVVAARAIAIKRQPVIELDETTTVQAPDPRVLDSRGAVPIASVRGSGPSLLAKPSFLRGTGNNWRRPVFDSGSSASTVTSGAKLEDKRFAAQDSVYDNAARTVDAFGRATYPGSSAGPGNYSPRPDQRAEPPRRVRSDAPPLQPSSSAMHAAPPPAWTASVRDPRVRARLEREVSLAPPGATRDTDHRAERNSSSAVRTMKANIEHMQAAYIAPAPAEPRGLSTVRSEFERRKVTFAAPDRSALSQVILDPSALEVADAADVACFSPVSCASESEPEDEVPPVRSFRVRAVDEADRGAPVSRITSTVPQTVARKSRFEAGPAPIATLNVASDVAKVISAPTTAAIVSVPAIVGKRKATAELEPGECDDDGAGDAPPPAALRTMNLARERAVLLPAQPVVEAVRSKTRFAAAGPIAISQPTVPTAEAPRAVAVNAPRAVPAEPAYMAPAQRQPPEIAAVVTAGSYVPTTVRAKIHLKIDPTYPHFNHSHDAAAAMAHMDVVMPACMSNLTDLLASTATPPPLGYPPPTYMAPVIENLVHVSREAQFIPDDPCSYAEHDEAVNYRANIAAAGHVRRSRFDNSAPHTSTHEREPVALQPRSSRWNNTGTAYHAQPAEVHLPHPSMYPEAARDQPWTAVQQPYMLEPRGDRDHNPYHAPWDARIYQQPLDYPPQLPLYPQPSGQQQERYSANQQPEHGGTRWAYDGRH
jgi:hypothetical protein